MREGVFHVFDLVAIRKHPAPMPTRRLSREASKRRFFAVLHIGAIDSLAAAVRAAIQADWDGLSQEVADYKACTGRDLNVRAVGKSVLLVTAEGEELVKLKITFG